MKTPTLLLRHRFSKILGVRVSELLGEFGDRADGSFGPVLRTVIIRMLPVRVICDR